MHLVPPLVGFGVLTTNIVEGLMCLWELQDNTGRSPSLIQFYYQRWPLKCMKTLKPKVVYEDIHIEDYDKRRHRVKTMEREDLVVSLFPFLLCWVVGTTVLLSGVQENQSEWLKWCLNKTYVFERRQWKQILSRVGWVGLLVAQVKLPRVFEIWPLEHVAVP